MSGAYVEELHPNKRIDLLVGYPEFVELIHGPLFEIYQASRQAAESRMRGETNGNIAIASEAQKILLNHFFGFDEDTHPPAIFPNAMSADASAIRHLVRPGNKIVTIDPTFGPFTQTLALENDPTKGMIRANGAYLTTELTAIFKTHPNIDLLVVNSPRNPDFEVFSAEDYRMLADLADKYGVTVLYDEVSAPYAPELAQIMRTGDRNRIEMNVPRSDSHIIVRDTGNLFPKAFPKVAAAYVSSAALAKGGQQMLDTLHSEHNATPNFAIVASMAEVLHSEPTVQLPNQLIALTIQNSTVLSDELHASVSYAGGFALVTLPADKVSAFQAQVSAPMLSDFYAEEHTSAVARRMVRIPLGMPADRFAHIASQLAVIIN